MVQDIFCHFLKHVGFSTLKRYKLIQLLVLKAWEGDRTFVHITKIRISCIKSDIGPKNDTFRFLILGRKIHEILIMGRKIHKMLILGRKIHLILGYTSRGAGKGGQPRTIQEAGGRGYRN